MTARHVLDFERPVVELEKQLEELKKNPAAADTAIATEIAFLEKQVDKLRQRIYRKLTPWQKVQVARHPERPRFADYLSRIFLHFVELHGDRLYGDDRAIIAGLAYLDDFKVMVVGQEKGKEVRDRVRHNFGMPHPEGYRKAARLFRLADKFRLPVVSFIDTPGAYPGIGAEERGQAHAIAENLRLLSGLKVPTVSINIGEGGSGGALAIGLADRVYMLEHAYYSVITPEGCASILWEDKQRAEEAADALALTADHLLKMGLIDGIIEEPLGGAQRDVDMVAFRIKKQLAAVLQELSGLSGDDLTAARYERLRAVGVFGNGVDSEQVI